MSNKFNWKWGETTPICAIPEGSSAISVGDLLWLDTDGKAQPASTFAKDTDLATTQVAFSQKFLGIAMQARPAGAISPIRVATTGIFEFEDNTGNAAQEFLGTYVGANLNSDATHLKSASVIAVSTATLGIGRIAHQENVPSGKVYVAILSTIIHGGVPGSNPLA